MAATARDGAASGPQDVPSHFPPTDKIVSAGPLAGRLLENTVSQSEIGDGTDGTGHTTARLAVSTGVSFPEAVGVA